MTALRRGLLPGPRLPPLTSQVRRLDREGRAAPCSGFQIKRVRLVDMDRQNQTSQTCWSGPAKSNGSDSLIGAGKSNKSDSLIGINESDLFDPTSESDLFDRHRPVSVPIRVQSSD